MRYFQILVALCLLLGTCLAEYNWTEEYLKTTADRVREHGYPAEEHYVETKDNYVLRLFRIPYSHKLQNEHEKKPAILLQHGLTSCSDAWLLAGPDNALAFLLADAGYDVWMSNARGNHYSRNNTKISPNHPYFWRFSWHEIATIDVATTIDYILANNTASDAVHYVGHSQGTAVFFVLMAERPEYNDKIKTAHLLAPVAFQSNLKAGFSKYASKLVGRPNRYSRLLDTIEVLSSAKVHQNVQLFCEKYPVIAFTCDMFYGGDSVNTMNQTIAAHMNETHPAGASSTQFIHSLQEYESGHFRQFDHGEEKNLLVYGRSTPPDYDVTKITAGTYLYYAVSDKLADPIDVEYLASLMPNVQEMFLVVDPNFSHSDFAVSIHVKEVVNDRIIGHCNKFEGIETIP